MITWQNWHNCTSKLLCGNGKHNIEAFPIIFPSFSGLWVKSQSRDIQIPSLCLLPPGLNMDVSKRKGVILAFLMNDWIPHLIFQAWPSTLGRKLISSAHIHSLVLLVLICSLRQRWRWKHIPTKINSFTFWLRFCFPQQKCAVRASLDLHLMQELIFYPEQGVRSLTWGANSHPRRITLGCKQPRYKLEFTAQRIQHDKLICKKAKIPQLQKRPHSLTWLCLEMLSVIGINWTGEKRQPCWESITYSDTVDNVKHP